MSEIARTLHLSLPQEQSAFLWGARKTGKSTLLRTLYPASIWFDLLDTDLFIELSKRPALLRERLLAWENKPALGQPIVLDEVQKIPMLLDEVHKLIEEKKLRFVLCGSSARKLKRGHANLLGGRAWRFRLFPLTSQELDELDLLAALNRGLIPSHYLTSHARRSLKSYVNDYLTEEIKAEGLTRNLPAFARFLDAAAYSNAELVNYSNIARDCGVDAKTVREFFEILVDTMLGYLILPWRRRDRRDNISSTPKFYFFDTGVANHLQRRRVLAQRGVEFGKSFEHLILMELMAHRSYSELDYDVRYWRAKSGHKIDFILGNGEVAIEVKGASSVDARSLSAIQEFAQHYPSSRAIVVCTEPAARRVGNVMLTPWREFLDALWAGEIV